MITASTNSASVRHRDLVGTGCWLLVIAWLAGTMAAFWKFDHSVGRQLANGQNSTLSPADTAQAEQWFRVHVGFSSSIEHPARVTLIHLYDPRCPCNRASEAQLKSLVEHYEALGVRFLVAFSPRSDDDTLAPLGLPIVSTKDRVRIASGIKSSASALIFDADGRLQYYGSYGDASWCGTAGREILESVLERRPVSPGRYAPGTPVLGARGCFCEW